MPPASAGLPCCRPSPQGFISQFLRRHELGLCHWPPNLARTWGLALHGEEAGWSPCFLVASCPGCILGALWAPLSRAPARQSPLPRSAAGTRVEPETLSPPLPRSLTRLWPGTSGPRVVRLESLCQAGVTRPREQLASPVRR